MSATSDREDIIELMTHYAWVGDNKLYDRFDEVFTDDFVAHFEGFSQPIRGLSEQIQFAREACDPLDGTQHIFSNFTIEIKGDNAQFRLYSQAAHMKNGATYFVAGHYHMGARRTAAGWRLYDLKFVPMWTSGDASILDHLTSTTPTPLTDSTTGSAAP